MISRSFLLLRLATGSANNIIFNECSIDPKLFKFWWEDIAENIGMIDSKPCGIKVE